METQVEARLAEIEAVLHELQEAAEQNSKPRTIITGAVYDQLGAIGNIRIGTSESDHNRVTLRLIAMQILAMIDKDTSGLLRVILHDPDASLRQKQRAISIWWRARRRH